MAIGEIILLIIYSGFITPNMSGEPLLRTLKNMGKCWFMVITRHYLKTELPIVMSGVVINAKN
jgi:hypothetical protein